MPEPAPFLDDVEEWFLRHGLGYFVPTVRAQVRAAMRPRRLLRPASAAVVLAAAGAVGAVLLGLPSAAPAASLTLAGGVVLAYGATALRAGPIVRWAVQQTFGGLRLLLPMASRALPLLLVFVTFLFVNAEAWQMTANLSPGLLWLTVLLLLTLAVVFLLVRLPEEVDRVDDAVDEEFLRRATAGTPAAGDVDAALARGVADHAQVEGYDRVNLILVLLVVQVVQVLLLAVAVFGFFLVFGLVVMDPETQQSWTGLARVHSIPGLANASAELLKVSLFLAAFSGLYFTVAAVTDDTYRGQFFAAVTDELERAVGVRAVYLTLSAGRRA